MKAILILLIVWSIALGSPSQISKRKPINVECDCKRDEPEKDEECITDCCGPDPCHECEEPKIHDKVYTPTRKQEINQNIILRCTPGSYFDSIEYQVPFIVNTTCTGFIAREKRDVTDLYFAIRKGKTPESLNAEVWKYVVTYLNGNSDWYETAELKDCECRGDILKSNSLWLATDPLTGCCTKGVNQVQATNYRLNIYGKCCSECYLIQASNTYPETLRN